MLYCIIMSYYFISYHLIIYFDHYIIYTNEWCFFGLQSSYGNSHGPGPSQPSPRDFRWIWILLGPQLHWAAWTLQLMCRRMPRWSEWLLGTKTWQLDQFIYVHMVHFLAGNLSLKWKYFLLISLRSYSEISPYGPHIFLGLSCWKTMPLVLVPATGFINHLGFTPIYGWLVVWNMAFIFPYIGNVIIPTDFHIFQRGRYTTNQMPIYIHLHLTR